MNKPQKEILERIVGRQAIQFLSQDRIGVSLIRTHHNLEIFKVTVWGFYLSPWGFKPWKPSDSPLGIERMERISHTVRWTCLGLRSCAPNTGHRVLSSRNTSKYPTVHGRKVTTIRFSTGNVLCSAPYISFPGTWNLKFPRTWGLAMLRLRVSFQAISEMAAGRSNIPLIRLRRCKRHDDERNTTSFLFRREMDQELGNKLRLMNQVALSGTALEWAMYQSIKLAFCTLHLSPSLEPVFVVDARLEIRSEHWTHSNGNSSVLQWWCTSESVLSIGKFGLVCDPILLWYLWDGFTIHPKLDPVNSHFIRIQAEIFYFSTRIRCGILIMLGRVSGPESSGAVAK